MSNNPVSERMVRPGVTTELGPPFDPPVDWWAAVSDPGARGLPLSPAESRRVTDDQLFRYLVDLEVVKAKRLDYPASVVCLAPDVSPAEARHLSTPQILRAILRRTRSTDSITEMADGSFAALLVDAETRSLVGIIARLRDELAAVSSGNGRSVTWSAGAACYPKSVASPADLIRLSADLLARARRDGGNRVYTAS